MARGAHSMLRDRLIVDTAGRFQSLAAVRSSTVEPTIAAPPDRDAKLLGYRFGYRNLPRRVERISIEINELDDPANGFPPPPPIKQRINGHSLVRFAFWTSDVVSTGSRRDVSAGATRPVRERAEDVDVARSDQPLDGSAANLARRTIPLNASVKLSAGRDSHGRCVMTTS